MSNQYNDGFELEINDNITIEEVLGRYRGSQHHLEQPPPLPLPQQQQQQQPQHSYLQHSEEVMHDVDDVDESDNSCSQLQVHNLYIIVYFVIIIYFL